MPGPTGILIEGTEIEHHFRIPIPGKDNSRLIRQSKSQAGQDLFVIAMLQGACNKTFLEIGAGHPRRGNNTWLLEKEFGYSGVSIDSYQNFQPSDNDFASFYQQVKDPSWPLATSLEELPYHLQQECIQVHGYQSTLPPIDVYDDAEYDWDKIRPNTKFYQCNAFEFDYKQIPDYFDYLQIDIEPEWANWLILEKIVANKEFAVITFEHDLWRNTTESKQAKDLACQLLLSQGYCKVADNVAIELDKSAFVSHTHPLIFEDWYANPKYVDLHIIETYKSLDPDPQKFYSKILFDPNTDNK